ncbi:362_t:CDS:2, partial [Paraglomus brasilianum]
SNAMGLFSDIESLDLTDGEKACLKAYFTQNSTQKEDAVEALATIAIDSGST